MSWIETSKKLMNFYVLAAEDLLEESVMYGTKYTNESRLIKFREEYVCKVNLVSHFPVFFFIKFQFG